MERAGHAPEHVGLVVGEFDLGPDAARKQSLVALDVLVIYVHVVQVNVAEPRPELVLGLLQDDGDLVNDLQSPRRLDPRLDPFPLVRLDVLAGETLSDELETLLAGLDQPEPEIIRLRLQGYSSLEIANQVGCSRWTVRRVLDRIGHRLHERLGDGSDH